MLIGVGAGVSVGVRIGAGFGGGLTAGRDGVVGDVFAVTDADSEEIIADCVGAELGIDVELDAIGLPTADVSEGVEHALMSIVIMSAVPMRRRGLRALADIAAPVSHQCRNSQRFGKRRLRMQAAGQQQGNE